MLVESFWIFKATKSDFSFVKAIPADFGSGIAAVKNTSTIRFTKIRIRIDFILFIAEHLLQSEP
jgi:hypothetical protein